MLKTLGGRLAMKRFEHTLQGCRVLFLKSAVLSTSFKGKHAKTLYCRTIYTSGKQPRSMKIIKNVRECAKNAGRALSDQAFLAYPPAISRVFVEKCCTVDQL